MEDKLIRYNCNIKNYINNDYDGILITNLIENYTSYCEQNFTICILNKNIKIIKNNNIRGIFIKYKKNIKKYDIYITKTNIFKNIDIIKIKNTKKKLYNNINNLNIKGYVENTKIIEFINYNTKSNINIIDSKFKIYYHKGNNKDNINISKTYINILLIKNIKSLNYKLENRIKGLLEEDKDKEEYNIFIIGNKYLENININKIGYKRQDLKGGIKENIRIYKNIELYNVGYNKEGYYNISNLKDDIYIETLIINNCYFLSPLLLSNLKIENLIIINSVLGKSILNNLEIDNIFIHNSYIQESNWNNVNIKNKIPKDKYISQGCCGTDLIIQIDKKEMFNNVSQLKNCFDNGKSFIEGNFYYMKEKEYLLVINKKTTIKNKIPLFLGKKINKFGNDWITPIKYVLLFSLLFSILKNISILSSNNNIDISIIFKIIKNSFKDFFYMLSPEYGLKLINKTNISLYELILFTIYKIIYIIILWHFITSIRRLNIRK